MKKPLAALISVIMTMTLMFSLTACAPSKAVNSDNSEEKNWYCTDCRTSFTEYDQRVSDQGVTG